MQIRMIADHARRASRRRVCERLLAARKKSARLREWASGAGQGVGYASDGVWRGADLFAAFRSL